MGVETAVQGQTEGDKETAAPVRRPSVVSSKERAAEAEEGTAGDDSDGPEETYPEGGREAWLVDGPLIERYRPPLGPGVAQRFAWARAITDTQVAAGATFRAEFSAHLLQLLGSAGVLLMPTMPDIAPRIDDDEAGLEAYRNAALCMLCIAGLAGLPQLNLPLATRLGAPLGLSLVGPPGSDRSLVRLAEQISPA